MEEFVLALDQGTTSSRAVLFDRNQQQRVKAQKELQQYYPQMGWVEHDPLEIWQSQKEVMEEVLQKVPLGGQVVALGITNQRETTIVWDKTTGKPVYNAIVWQCRRTAQICEQWAQDSDFLDYVKKATGLLLDAYFSATKLKWILDNVANARKRAENGELLFGTVDTWLMWQISAGKLHISDSSNAARTMLFNIKSLSWDEKILKKLDIPACMLPKIVSNSEVYTEVSIASHNIAVAGMAGDQHAALFGQACFQPGMVKNTYGTGSFLIMNTGQELKRSQHNLLSTIAWTLDGVTEYALEGAVFVAGAVIQWLRDELGLISHAEESEQLANSVESSNGAYFVPAFTGLGAPYWDMHARGTIVGLTRGVNKAHLVRAALEGIAYQTQDVLACMRQDANLPLQQLRVDGGASLNNFLMQFQANLLMQDVVRPQIIETTALGAACLAGLAVGFWQDKKEIANSWQLDQKFSPTMDKQQSKQLYEGWLEAVKRSRSWQNEALVTTT